MTKEELEYRLLYSMVVAGKSAKFADAAMERFLGDPAGDWTPFMYVEYLVTRGLLRQHLEEARTGNYTKLALAFEQVAKADIDLATCTPTDLEAIHGIGPKTSRFFIIWTRPEASFAALDTHVLKWLRHVGHKAPKSTPSGAKYAYFEGIFLALAKTRGMTARDLDAAIWDWCSTYPERVRAGIWPAILQP